MLKFLSEAEAEDLFTDTFIKWRMAYNYRGCSDTDDTRAIVNWAKGWAWRSRTAQNLMNYVQSSDKTIYVVGMRGGFQCFNSTEGPAKDMPVVFIDVQGKINANVRTEHMIGVNNEDVAPEDCRNGTFEIDNKIAILHEFGHAKQWVERPLLFDGDVKNSKSFRDDIRKRAQEINQRALTANDGTFTSKTRREMAPGEAHKVTRTAEQFQSSTEYDNSKPISEWGVRIEMDNMARHEWPICKELGLPRRINYRDLNGTSAGIGTTTTKIVELARAYEQQEAAAERRRQEREQGTQVKGNQCPACGQSVGNMVLHQRKCPGRR